MKPKRNCGTGHNPAPQLIHSNAKRHREVSSTLDTEDPANPVPFRERICCSIPEACYVGGFGRTTIYHLISSGRVKTVKIGRRTLINIKSLLALLEPADEVGQRRG
jgi:excisionase family DNA binding protein